MRGLLYILLLSTVTAFVMAQTPDTPTTSLAGSNYDSIPLSDTIIASDTMMPADTLVMPDTLPQSDTSAVRRTYPEARNQRRVSAVNNASTRTQHYNDAQGDTARMIERRRQRSIHYHDADGRVVMVDTVTGQEWIDSTMLPKPPKMKLPLMYAAEIGVNIWDPVMRLFGQKYGGVDFSAALNLHNRYIPTFEAGFGMADNTPAGMSFTYKTPLAPYFKLGADYNFIYNSDPDYRFVAGVRYGFSAFSYHLENVMLNDSYWGSVNPVVFPGQNVTAGWGELVLGLRVKLGGPISAGWMFRFHTLLHQTHPASGDAWYIPGYGSTSSTFTASFSIVYKITFNNKVSHTHNEGDND
ncbi:MAG: hypothetical protein J1F20_03815 [Muribaculaceae bacterium]|nr:hypothetical protein [Muribaculaceae bacterium]